MTGFDELPPPERELARRLQATLRTQDDGVDAVMTARLRAARARALDDAPGHRVSGWLFASGGLAAATALAVLLVMHPLRATTSGPASGSAQAPQAEALEVLTDDVDAELYEDLELYRWLEREHDGAA
jgi:hypothetical protein